MTANPADALTPEERQTLIALLDRAVATSLTRIPNDRAGVYTSIAHKLGLHRNRPSTYMTKADAWDDLLDRVQRASSELELLRDGVQREIDARPGLRVPDADDTARFRRLEHLDSKMQGVGLVIGYMAEYKVDPGE